MSVSVVSDNTDNLCVDQKLDFVYGNSPSSPLEAKHSKKRKYAEAELSSCGLQSHVNEIALPGSNGSIQPLTSKYIITRSSLPLAYLDPALDGELAPSSRLFAAWIEVLEETDDNPQQYQPRVLLAHSTNCDRFYAIERVRAGLYACCRLGKWVAENVLRELCVRAPAANSCPLPTTRHEDENFLAHEWWRSAIATANDFSNVSSLDPDAIARAHKFKLSLQRPSITQSPPLPPPTAISAVAPTKFISESAELFNDGIQEPKDSLKIIKTQYQDALYLSRTPLAYFAKGPLSRARASFQSHEGSGSGHLQLIQYLRLMILDLQVMDRKYRETLPVLIKDFPFTPMSDGEDAPIIEELRKRGRRSKKEKVGKDGLYSGEDIKIARWWLGRDLSGNSRHADDAQLENIKTTVLNLQRREAQLQIILLLETLALEKNSAAFVDKSTGSGDVDLDQGSIGAKAKKTKKPQDLNTLLDLLADKLCIWQSMSLEVEKSVADQRMQKKTDEKATDPSNNDELRQFCVDVVVPFYGSRLPEASTLLCQKLGGPKDPSPRRASTKVLEAKTSSSIKPGAPLPRPQLRKQKRTLERVLTEDRSSQRRKTPSLSRSATEPLVPIKRELSDSTLSSIPVNKVAASKRYTQREVDLKATSQASQSKYKKKIAIEQELQGAIAAIKRPNPKMAGVEFVESVEKRQANSLSKKASNLGRKRSTQDFQVMATPSRNKEAGSYKLPKLPPTQRAALHSEISEVPPSSVGKVIPSSTGKILNISSHGKRYVDRDDRKHQAAADQTPSKGPARFTDRPVPNTETHSVFTNSQLQVRKPSAFTSHVQETPSKTPAYQSSTSPPTHFNIQVTPCKANPVHKPPLDVHSPCSQVEEPDIYTRLGWNYEVDD